MRRNRRQKWLETPTGTLPWTKVTSKLCSSTIESSFRLPYTAHANKKTRRVAARRYMVNHTGDTLGKLHYDTKPNIQPEVVTNVASLSVQRKGGVPGDSLGKLHCLYAVKRQKTQVASRASSEDLDGDEREIMDIGAFLEAPRPAEYKEYHSTKLRGEKRQYGVAISPDVANPWRAITSDGSENDVDPQETTHLLCSRHGKEQEVCNFTLGVKEKCSPGARGRQSEDGLAVRECDEESESQKGLAAMPEVTTLGGNACISSFTANAGNALANNHCHDRPSATTIKGHRSEHTDFFSTKRLIILESPDDSAIYVCPTSGRLYCLVLLPEES